MLNRRDALVAVSASGLIALVDHGEGQEPAKPAAAGAAITKTANQIPCKVKVSNSTMAKPKVKIEDETFEHTTGSAYVPTKKSASYDANNKKVIITKLLNKHHPTMIEWKEETSPTEVRLDISVVPENTTLNIGARLRVDFSTQRKMLSENSPEKESDKTKPYRPCCVECNGVVYCRAGGITVDCDGIIISCEE